MKLTKIVGTDGCDDRNCPTVYETDRGTFVVQGARVANDAITRLGMPDDETVVEIPRSLVADLLQRFRG